MDRRVQDRVVGVRPERKDLVSWEALKSQLPALVVRKQPALPTDPCALPHVPHYPAELGPQHGVQGFRIPFVLRVERKWPPKRIVRLLVDHLGVNVIDKPVVGEVVQDLDVPVIVQRDPAAVKHVLGPVIVRLRRQLPLPCRRVQPGPDFQLQEALVGHALLKICCCAGQAVTPQIKHHHGAPPPSPAFRRPY